MGAGVVICLERGADLHMAQLMPLPLTVSCLSKIQICFTFLVLAHLGSPGKGPLNGCVCVLNGCAWHTTSVQRIVIYYFYCSQWVVWCVGCKSQLLWPLGTAMCHHVK